MKSTRAVDIPGDDHDMHGDLFHGYIRSLHLRRVSPDTLRTASSVLGIVERYTGKPLELCTLEDLRRWQERRADELTERSLRTQVSYVKQAYSWGMREGYLRTNPAARLEAPKVPAGLPRPIPENRLEHAWHAADDRMRAILALGAFAGLRACEVARLDWADVFLDDPEPYLRVVGKGRKERSVDVSPELAAVLLALPSRRGPVIRRADGRPGHNSPVRISKLANTFLRGLEIPDTFHATRHRFGTELCAVAGIRKTQEAMGHATPGPTALYTRVRRADLRPHVLAIGRLLTDAS